MEMKIDRLHRSFLEAELRNMIHRGKKTGVIHEKDLHALLSGVVLTEESRQALNRRLEEAGIRTLPEQEDGSVCYPRLEELKEAFAASEPTLMYLAELEKNGIVRCLTLEEEAALSRRCQEEQSASEALTEGNLLRVASIARQYMGLGMDILDLLSEGNRGLLEAVKSFHPEFGCPFVLYAVCGIRRAICDGLDVCIREVNRHPSEAVLAAAKMAAEQRKNERLAAMENSTAQEEPDAGEKLAKLRKMVEELADSLTEREAEVLRMRLGMKDGKCHSLEEVAQHFGITRERVRQIENKTIRRAKRGCRRKPIRDFYA